MGDTKQKRLITKQGLPSPLCFDGDPGWGTPNRKSLPFASLITVFAFSCAIESKLSTL
ncbi:MAG: hypothetical protein K0B05_05250 [Bacteroidales bacterium]|nr:hypothetical protein [Bacteroidales bacterium]